MSQEFEFESWLESTDQLRARLLEYSRSPIPTDPGERQLDVSKALTNGQDAGDLLADAELYLSQAFAQAVLDARLDHDASTAKILAKAKTAKIERLRDGMHVIYTSIKERRFVLMSIGRW